MSDDREDRDKDEQLAGWLQEAPDPQAPPRLDARVSASYRAALARPWPARAWHARLSVPLPVAALVVLVLVAAGALGREVRWPKLGGGGSAASGLAGLKPLAEVQIRVASKEGR